MDVPEKSLPSPSGDPATHFSFVRMIYNFPWWLAMLALLGLYVARLILTNATYNEIFSQLRDGISMTLGVSFIAYTTALFIGLLIGLIRANPPKRSYGFWGTIVSVIRLFLYNAATLYVQVLRGLPILVTLLIVAFVIIPAANDFIQASFGIETGIRGSSPPAAIIALAFTYGAFLSETFRAGIQSVDRGQTEAARSLGMTYTQVMQLVVLPQAIRRVLPPLGNDMIAMVKDSSLVAILGVRDITQLAKLYSSQSFLYLQTYLIAAMIYLAMTILGSFLVRYLERKYRVGV